MTRHTLFVGLAGCFLLVEGGHAGHLLPPSNPATVEVTIADFNGDGLGDLAVRDLLSTRVDIHLNANHQFAPTPSWSTQLSVANAAGWDTLFADISGDGKADLINRNRANGDLFIYFNNGSGFTYPGPYVTGMSPVAGFWKTLFADVNGDGKADLVNVNLHDGIVYRHLGNGSAFEPVASGLYYKLVVPSDPFNGWEPLLQDCNGDGRADFVNWSQPQNRIWCHHTDTAGNFSEGATNDFEGLPDTLERELQLEDVNGDGLPEMISINLRNGDIVAYPMLSTAPGTGILGHHAVLFHRTHATVRRNGQRPLIEDSARSLAALMWYDIDHVPNHPARPSGWWNLYVGAPLSEPLDKNIYRSDTPLLGTYASGNPKVIRQHAYWMRALGADGFVIDWTNCHPNDPNPSTPESLETYCDNIKADTGTLVSQMTSITQFAPPKALVAMRAFSYGPPGMQTPDYVEAQHMADEVYNAYLQHPDGWYKFNDGTANADKPVLLVFVEFTDPLWRTNGPQWSDAQNRFNIRYTNGYFRHHQLTTPEVPAVTGRSHVVNDYPYWPFVENELKSPGIPGYYQHVYRRLPADTTQSEAATAWSAVSVFGPQWDGQQVLINGKTPIQRTIEPLLGKPPRNLLLGRFNYPIAWLSEPQEGVSTSGSSYIEPSEFTGFDVYNATAREVHTMKRLVGKAPGKPLVTRLVNATTGPEIELESANFPTEYCITTNGYCAPGSWKLLPLEGRVPVPVSPFSVITRNAFGLSPATAHP